MTQEQRAQIKTNIIMDIEKAKEEIIQLEEKTKPIAPDCSLGRLTRLEAMGEQQVNEHALQETRIRLNRLVKHFIFHGGTLICTLNTSG